MIKYCMVYNRYFEGDFMSIKNILNKKESHLITIVIELISSKTNIEGPRVYNILSKYGGIDFLISNYDVEHTLSLSQIIEDTLEVCRENGGNI
jgi:hypothetical protein